MTHHEYRRQPISMLPYPAISLNFEPFIPPMCLAVSGKDLSKFTQGKSFLVVLLHLLSEMYFHTSRHVHPWSHTLDACGVMSNVNKYYAVTRQPTFCLLGIRSPRACH